MDTILVSVTREDIDNGKCAFDCAVDLALRRHFQSDRCNTGISQCTVTNANGNVQRFKFRELEFVSNWIFAFDRAAKWGYDRSNIQPITIELIPIKEE